MTEPLQPTGRSPDPTVIELGPMVISAHPRGAPPDVPIPVGEIALRCLSKLDGVALAAMAAPVSQLVAGLAAVKAGLELGECVAEVMNRAEEEASIQRAIEECVNDGGVPLGVVRDTLTCGVPVGTL